jgi:hypothetical protein
LYRYRSPSRSEAHPGKALFRLRLVSYNNEPNYFGRSIAVWAAGMGFGIPLLCGLVALNAGTRLKQKGKPIGTDGQAST